jgi:Cys-tRNA(Pro)/Cys-tRNA(Cys) deacylase
MCAAKSKSKASAGTPAVRALERQGMPFRLHAYDFGGVQPGLALEAAGLMGVAPARVLKTLMAVVDDRTVVVCLVPADRELNLKELASALGGKRAAMANVREAERASGYVKGGISPLGQRQRAPAVVDRSALEHDSVFVNGGRRGLQIELAPADLIAALEARVAAIAR